MARDIVTLRQTRAKAFDALNAIEDTVANQAQFDAAAAEVEALDKEIANAEQLQKLKGDGASGTSESGDAGAAAGARGFVAKYRNMPGANEKRHGAILTNGQLAGFGDLLMSTRRAANNRGVDPLLIEASLGANESVGEDGGFLVEKDIADSLLTRTFQQSTIASKVRRIPISAKSNGLKINALKDDSRATGARWGGLQVYHIGEGDALTPSRPKFRQMNLQLKKMAGLLYATDEALQDSTALAALISEAFPAEFSFTLDDVIFEGAGASTGLGFMNSGCKVTVAKESGQTAKTIEFENITKMWARCPARSMAKAEWWINQDALPQLMSLSMVIGTGGVPVYLPAGGLSQTPYGLLFGRPVIPMEFCSTLGTEGDIVLCDPSNYVMIDKGDIQYATSIHVAFLTNEQAFRFIYRYDGQPVDDKPITPFKGTDKQSTFITLATRA
jgi:HK97 family phage major capsid protein